MYYVLSDDGHNVKDVTRRYAGSFMTETRKLRCDEDWVAAAVSPYVAVSDSREEREDREMEKSLSSAPLPTTVSAFKDHPLYVLQRHLLKFEAIYPKDAPTLGFIKGEGVYAR